jgi:hypothetical protein
MRVRDMLDDTGDHCKATFATFRKDLHTLLIQPSRLPLTIGLIIARCYLLQSLYTQDRHIPVTIYYSPTTGVNSIRVGLLQYGPEYLDANLRDGRALLTSVRVYSVDTHTRSSASNISARRLWLA